MPMKKCVLEGRSFTSLNDVYDSLARQLNFPAHFGRNLDALWDVLTTDIPGPLSITWKAYRASRAALGPDYIRISRLLQEVARERHDVILRYR
ncbi:MAG TPA: barstar family protein [bacterium]|nr:barstar family protein [bacterium]